MRAIARIVPQKNTASLLARGVLRNALTTRQLVRVQRCGKSAPAVPRGTGSVNPGREQGRRDDGWSFSDPDLGEPHEMFGNKHPR